MRGLFLFLPTFNAARFIPVQQYWNREVLFSKLEKLLILQIGLAIVSLARLSAIIGVSIEQ